MRDDDDGQVDGDGAAYLAPGTPGSPFASSFASAPWLGALPPWHMWGNIETVRVPITGLNLLQGAQQIAKANYKRPDTWQWLFYARLASAPTPAIPGNSITVNVDFNLTVGLGRGSVTLPVFERFNWTWIAPAGPPTDTGGAIIWSTTAIQPERIASADPDHSIFQIVAQDINCGCTVNVVSQEAPLATVVVEVGAFFAPRSHMRPDWYKEIFAGDETGGT